MRVGWSMWGCIVDARWECVVGDTWRQHIVLGILSRKQHWVIGTRKVRILDVWRLSISWIEVLWGYSVCWRMCHGRWRNGVCGRCGSVLIGCFSFYVVRFYHSCQAAQALWMSCYSIDLLTCTCTVSGPPIHPMHPVADR